MPSHAAHDHGHEHGHGHERRHDHAHAQGDAPVVGAPHAPGFSLLRLSALERLAGAAGLSILIWAGVVWAL